MTGTSGLMETVEGIGRNQQQRYNQMMEQMRQLGSSGANEVIPMGEARRRVLGPQSSVPRRRQATIAKSSPRVMMPGTPIAQQPRVMVVDGGTNSVDTTEQVSPNPQIPQFSTASVPANIFLIDTNFTFAFAKKLCVGCADLVSVI